MEFWTSHTAAPTKAAAAAQQAQALGWDGIGTVDSQNLSGDPYVFLALAATGASALGLQTAVTNPVTRHAAVTASSALSVQRVSGGRMRLGIGRGDSALAHLGRAPARLRWFENYLIALQAYLRGEEMPLDQTSIPEEAAPHVASLALAHAPEESAIRWAASAPKVPVEVAATGPKVIALAARHADRTMFALGTNPNRIAWGIDTARAAATAAGRDPEGLRFGAYVNVACHRDPQVARTLSRTGTSLFARFSVMHGDIAGPVDEAQASMLQAIHANYDMTQHAQAGSDQADALTDEFIDDFAIAGDVDHCVSRLSALAALGVDKFAVVGPNFTADDAEAREAGERFARQVIPALRR